MKGLFFFVLCFSFTTVTRNEKAKKSAAKIPNGKLFKLTLMQFQLSLLHCTSPKYKAAQYKKDSPQAQKRIHSRLSMLSRVAEPTERPSLGFYKRYT